MSDARGCLANKRSAGPQHEALDGIDAPAGKLPFDPVALDCALNELEALDARLVELRKFTGMTMSEVAGVLDISESRAFRDWRMRR